MAILFSNNNGNNKNDNNNNNEMATLVNLIVKSSAMTRSVSNQREITSISHHQNHHLTSKNKGTENVHKKVPNGERSFWNWSLERVHVLSLFFLSFLFYLFFVILRNPRFSISLHFRYGASCVKGFRYHGERKVQLRSNGY